MLGYFFPPFTAKCLIFLLKVCNTLYTSLAYEICWFPNIAIKLVNTYIIESIVYFPSAKFVSFETFKLFYNKFKNHAGQWQQLLYVLPVIHTSYCQDCNKVRYYLQKLRKDTKVETRIYRLLDLESVCNNRCTPDTSKYFLILLLKM